MNRYVTPAALWLALVTVLIASWTHVAGTFGTLEHGGPPTWLQTLAPYTAPLAAVAVDVGLIALVWGVGARARSGQPARDLWAGVIGFALLSALANFDHALGVVADGANGWAAFVALPLYGQVKVIALSATLPVLALYLARVLETAAAAEREAGGAPASDTVEASSVAPSPAPLPHPSPDIIPPLVVQQEPAPVVAPEMPAGYAIEVRQPTTRKVRQKRTRDPRPRIIRVALSNPDASQRKLAQLAKASPTTVGEMVKSGELRKNGSGWAAGAAEGGG